MPHQKINLAKLLEKPNATVSLVECELSKVFPCVYIADSCEPFFNLRIYCRDDDGRLRLIVRFGWSERKTRWFFEPLKPTNE
jgi:hypothetical protein